MPKNFALIKDLIRTSRAVRTARHGADPIASNKELSRLVRSSPGHTLSPTWALWIGDTLKLDAQFEEALDAYAALITDYPRAHAQGRSMSEKAMMSRVACFERLGDRSSALKELRRVLSGGPSTATAARVYHRIGRVYERSGNKAAAVRAYSQGTRRRSAADQEALVYSGLCRRNATRLRSGEPWVRRTPELLANDIQAALRRDDFSRLKALASRSHFAIGRSAGEHVYIASGRILSLLKTTLGRIRTNPGWLSGQGAKRLLEIRGLTPEAVGKKVYFSLDRFHTGWAWTGVVGFWDDLWRLFQPCDTPRDDTTSPDLELSIKAPWPAGVRCFAGGLGGLYYNTAPTHCGGSAFAVDFGRLLATHGTQVLAVQEGTVSAVRDEDQDGDSDCPGNQVSIKHWLGPEVLLAALTALFGDNDYEVRYRSSSLHLRGPEMILVSEGMWVDQGTILGQMDDTGRSVDDHLHFSLTDKTAGELIIELPQGDTFVGRLSVMPSPMDGVTLGPNDGGTLITSTNEPIP